MRNIIIILLTCLVSITAHAQQSNTNGQQRQDNRPKMDFSQEQFIKEMKSFIINEAKLTQDEADKFFPMLFEMQGKTRQVQKKIRDLIRKAHVNEQQMNESQYESLVAEICKLEVSERQIEQTYYKKFHRVLSWKKIYKVHNAISAFHMRAIGMFQRGKKPDGNFMPPQQPTQHGGKK